MPDWYGIVPVTFSVASSMIQYCFGYDPMISVPLPADTRGFSAERTIATALSASAKTINLRRNVIRIGHSRENQIDLAPVLLRRRALRRPVGRVIQLVGHLRRPVAADVTVEQIALDRLTESGSTAAAIRLPARREHERAPEREVRHLRDAVALQRDDVARRCLLDAYRLAVN